MANQPDRRAGGLSRASRDDLRLAELSDRDRCRGKANRPRGPGAKPSGNNLVLYHSCSKERKAGRINAESQSPGEDGCSISPRLCASALKINETGPAMGLSFPNLPGRDGNRRHGIAGIDNTLRPVSELLVIHTSMSGRNQHYIKSCDDSLFPW